jgi:hypothetical protein
LTAAFAAIDAVNAEDPNQIEGRPRALLQGELATKWLARRDPDASDALRFAARAHHLRRWVIPRDARPDGRVGYLRWRRELKAVHAEGVAEVLGPLGIAPEVVARVQALVTKHDLGSDPEAQAFEDVVCLVFLETQYDELIDRLDDDDKVVDVLRKTIAKMSPAGLALAGDAVVPGRTTSERAAALLERALAGSA